MSEFSNALYRGITRGRSPATEGATLAAMVAEVQRALGTTPPPGVSSSTWLRLRSGQVQRPTPRVFAAVRDAQRRARLSARREKRLRGDSSGIVVKATVLISNDVRDHVRKFRVGKLSDAPPRYGPPITGMLNPVLDAWLRRDDAGAEEAFMAPIRASLGTPTVAFTDIKWISLGDREPD